ncbi:hypothetical protein N7481_002527 [Penicillium waksmanii]|uniref:uncharacterized protein n=1 Tax=Penicillium waksmanii TaxID=69791 RepID=UPI0025479CD3|nr:uncharacterized protein N7481_002527 [Penicillium waksmanii]KAJ5995550.1 hypothetical protein N7481_002527 [Penicillium waksmanii]
MSGFRHAFSLPSGQVRAATPPGTVILTSLHATEHGESAQSHELVLIPQPTSSPLDPLNWTTWRKAAVLTCMSLYAAIGNFTSASIASAFPLYATPLAFNPPVSIGKLTHLIAVNVLMMGAANIWWVPLANIFGRRPIILGNLLLLVLCSMWAGLATSFENLLAARIFMGIAVAPADTSKQASQYTLSFHLSLISHVSILVAPNVVGEIFFAHQRGRAMGCYTVCICLGPIIGGISGGYIAGNKGLAWIHWVNVILAAILMIACIALVPETLFNRAPAPLPSQSEIPTTTEGKPDTEIVENMTTTSLNDHTNGQTLLASMLKLHRYEGDILQKFLAPWKTLLLPGVWLVMFWYAGLVGGVVTITTVGPTLVAGPPYLWGNDSGLIMTGGIIGAVLGFIMTNLSADRIILTKTVLRGSSFVEPERRLLIAIPGLILATTGLWTFGFCAQNPGPSHMWVGMQFGLGMLCFGLMQAPSIGFNYLIDAYGPLAADCFVAVTCMRAIISFAWTFFAGEWVSSAGPATPFGVFGALMGVFSLFTIPMWAWGKRTRIATANMVPNFS